jgi:cell division septal protein FtsQ
MRAHWKIGFGIALLALALSGAAASPRAFRRMDAFRVRRVEVHGTQYLPPREAVRLSKITRTSNVFDDFSIWQRALEQHVLIDSVRIDRVLPATVRLWIYEVHPVALTNARRTAGADAGAGAELLVPVDAEGRVLPIDPSLVDLDLPVVTAPASAPVLRLLAEIRSVEPELYAMISEASPASAPTERGVRVRLRAPAGAVVLLSDDPHATQLRELKVTLADLVARQELNRLERIDARFRGQVVTALRTSDAQ